MDFFQFNSFPQKFLSFKQNVHRHYMTLVPNSVEGSDLINLTLHLMSCAPAAKCQSSSSPGPVGSFHSQAQSI